MYTTHTEQLDDLLDLTCRELQLPTSWHDEAEQHYHAVAAWLEAPGSALRAFRPEMYPQGSFAIGTTVRPIGRDEFDLDFVCQLALEYWRYQPEQVLALVESRLREHETYRGMIERLKRCVRLTYAGRFYMDILPACPDSPPNGTCVRVPDRALREWKASNPRGYVSWFRSRSGLYLAQQFTRSVDPLPAQEDADGKSPLQRSAQLIKRWRDLAYRRDPKAAPCSIVVTTLAAQAYSGKASTAEALTTILDELVRLTGGRTDPVPVFNPANPEELLSEQWRDQPATFHLFAERLRALAARWHEALDARGPSLAAILEELFGEETRTAYRRQAERVASAREDGRLRAGLGSGILTTSPSRSAIVRPTTFHGDADHR